MNLNVNSTQELPLVLTDAIRKINSMYDIVLSMQKKAESISNKEDSETYLSVSQVAELTHYSNQTIRTKVMGDEIPSFRMNGRRLFRKSDILKYIANGGR